MRGRIGGRFGVASPPTSYSASGIWSLADVHAAGAGAYGSSYEFGGAWPKNSITVAWPISGYPSYQTVDYVDATETGGGTFSPTITSTYPSVSYSWEKSTDSGVSWSTVSGENSSTLTLSGQTLSNNGELYRIVADAGLKTVISTAGTLRYDTVAISWVTQPEAYSSVAQGGYFYLSVYATATGSQYSATYGLSYQWQESTDGGSTWTNVSGQTSSYFYSYAVTSGMNGRKYRCAASFSGQTSYSNTSTLTVT